MCTDRDEKLARLKSKGYCKGTKGSNQPKKTSPDVVVISDDDIEVIEENIEKDVEYIGTTAKPNSSVNKVATIPRQRRSDVDQVLRINKDIERRNWRNAAEAAMNQQNKAFVAAANKKKTARMHTSSNTKPLCKPTLKTTSPLP